ncbi:protein FAM185A isoform X1 [Pseudonaja textilis]|uniref:Family with sequence similarity 185 member A n=1 Tax=Pseudonaja textilis TaxID=8673 RepID=A0A670Z844_PSETE|nr:protein FAM185A isoform X1 [Pseudonaja textilis]
MVHSRLPGWCYLAGKALSRSNRGLLKGKKSPHKVALFTSEANLGPTEKDPKTNKLLKEWTLVVTPFGLLKARLPCHITVGPLDPHKYPDSDKVFVALKGRDSNPDPASGLLVNYDEARKEVIISGGMDGTASLDVRTPVNFDLDIKTTRNGSVKIEQMQCANCKVETEKGASILKSIKSHKIDLRAKGGDVTCLGTLQGNTDILVSQESNVNIEKLQGSSINITSENGLLKAKYLYSDSSFLTSVAGDILLGNVHGDITLETKTGSITVDSSEGSLKALTSRGEINAYVLRQTGEVNLASQEGSITLKVPATLQTSLKLSGRKVEISPEIQLQEIQTVSSEDRVAVTGHMGQKDAKGRHIKAETQHGTVNLKCQSWFQSLKLKIP